MTRVSRCEKSHSKDECYVMGLCEDNDTHIVRAGTDRHNGPIKGLPQCKTGMQAYTYVCNANSR